MADPTNTQTVDVELLAQGADVSKAMDLIQAKIEKALAAVNQISSSADSGVKNFDRKLNQSVKSLQQAMSQLSTLEKSMYAGAGGVRQLTQAQQFGKSTEAAARFAGTVRSAGNAVEAVGARINDLTKKMAGLGQQDFLPKRKLLRAQDDLRAIDRELRSVDRSLTNLNTKARQNGGDFAAQQRQVAEAQAALFRSLRDGRRTNFTTELNQLRDAMARYGADVRRVDADLRRQGQAYDQLISKARQYTNETRFQQEGRLRREAGRLAIPDGVTTAGAAEKLAQATLRAANAKERLNAALASKAGQAELSKAVADYERYNRELVESIALHNKLQAELKQSAAAQAAEAAQAARAAKKTQQAQAQRGPVSTILSPGYGAAAFARTSVYGAAAMAAYGLFNTFRDGVRFVFEFDDALANLQAVSAATDGQMTHLRDTILDIGTNSKFSTLEITEAAQQLAQAGFSTSEMEKSLKAVTELAAASGASIKESTDLITASIGGFGLQSSEAERVADVMTSALNRSRLTVQQAGLAVSYLGATAHDVGISLNDVLASVGALSQAGVRSGSTAGTGLRTFLTDLLDPSEKLKKQLSDLGLTLGDVDVRTRGLRPVMETLRNAGFGAAQAYGSLEIRAAAAYLVLSQNLDVMDDLNLAMLQQGTAAEAAEKSLGSFSAQWQRFKNIIADRADDGNKKIADSFAEIVKGINDYLERAGETNDRIAQEVQARRDLVASLKEQALAAQQAGDEDKAYALAQRAAFEESVNRSAGIYAVAQSQEDLETKISNTNETLAANNVRLGAVDEAIARLLVQQDTLTDNSAALSAELLQLGQRFDGLSEKLMSNVQSFQGALNALRQYRAEVLAFQGQQLGIQKNQLASQYDLQRNQYVSADRGLNRINDPQFQRLRKQLTSAMANGSYADRFRANQALSDYTESKLDPRHRDSARRFIGAAGKLASTTQQYGSVKRDAEKVDYFLSNSGQSITESGSVISAGLQRANANTTGRTDSEQKRYYTDVAQKTAAAAAQIRRDAANAPTEGMRRGMLEQATYLDGLAAQAEAATKPSLKELKEGERVAKASQRAAAREARRRLRGDKFVSQAALKTVDMDLKQAIEDNSEPLNLDQFLEGAAEIDKQLELWIEERQKLIEAEIKEKGLTGEAADTYRREISEQIQNRKEETEQKLADAIIAMVENSLEIADRLAEEHMRPFEYGLAMADARIQRLNRTDMVGRVPDYVRENAEFRKQQLEESAARGRLTSYGTQIAAREQALRDYEMAIASRKSPLEALGSSGSDDEIVVSAETRAAVERFAGKSLKELQDAAYATQQELFQLRTESDALKLSLDGASEIPLTIGEAFNQAAAAYARVTGLNRTMKESIINDLGGAIEQVHGAFTNFFTDMLTKPDQVLNNLRNFALSVIRVLQEMAAKALANEIFGMLLKVGASLLGGSAPSGGGSGGNATFGGHAPFFNGGLVGRAEGGLVTEGVPNRDSVATKLARGEFVTRKAAVDSVGVDFMRDLNKRGAQALQGMGVNVIPLRPSRMETNVWVVAPEEKPQLGPNDVIAVMTNEMLKESGTKKLIKSIAQGG
ncbi:phage tail tape measure protein [Sphingopyxis flava]|uniref:Phage tail tape measure protein, TP901 family, core region n=1 Tax=Sphingopyxis flava TaxID=1507287 RepID=A0A1T5CSS8_9SPHN|nr:phage tail tape measure protein [Sphingopyxis flava]SKB62240.1 phage tail tape measure protein, TP901 family, core region [Sphingopyxis flava]